ncbi:MAG: hypothetical protein V4568_14215 [Pseudomonadota bacterium]
MTQNIDISVLLAIANQERHDPTALINMYATRKASAGQERFLTTHAAAAFIQPFIPRKNAHAWLLLDAQNEPMVPVLKLVGVNLYRWTDLVHFVITKLGASAEFAQPSGDAVIERRGGERRHAHRQRVREEIRLADGIERRHELRVDRRLAVCADRRKKTVE